MNILLRKGDVLLLRFLLRFSLLSVPVFLRHKNFWSRGFRQDIGRLPALPVYLVEKWQGGNRVFLLAEESFHFGYDIRMFFLCHNILDENHQVLVRMIQFGYLLAAVDLMQNKVFLVESLFLNQILLHFQRNVLLNRFGLLRLCVFLLIKSGSMFYLILLLQLSRLAESANRNNWFHHRQLLI